MGVRPAARHSFYDVSVLLIYAVTWTIFYNKNNRDKLEKQLYIVKEKITFNEYLLTEQNS